MTNEAIYFVPNRQLEARVCFGVFDTRAKAIDSAKWQELYNHNSEVVVLEVTLNLFEEV